MTERHTNLIWAAIVIVVLAAMFAFRRQPDNELLGVWKVDRIQTNGASPHGGRSFWVFTPNQFVIVGDDETQGFRFKIDPSMEPKHFNADMLLWDKGIYEIDGSTLRIAQASKVSQRPTEFLTRFGDLVQVTELTRMEFENDRIPSLNELHAKLPEVFGPAKTYDEPIEFDSDAETFVLDLVRSIPEHGPISGRLQLVDRVRWLDVEINNGGFHQFFFNSSGGTALDVIDDLKTIGATSTAELVTRGCELFPGGKPSSDLDTRRKQLEAFSLDDHEIMRDLENQFYSRREDLNVLLKRYWEEQNATE